MIKKKVWTEESYKIFLFFYLFVIYVILPCSHTFL